MMLIIESPINRRSSYLLGFESSKRQLEPRHY